MEEFLLNPWTLTLLLTGVIFALAGWILIKYPPKSINWFYGYRTKRSMKSQENWDFAQVFAGRQMIGSGTILFVLGFMGPLIPLPPLMAVGLSLALVIVFAFIPFLRVEAALKRRFE